MGKRILYKYLDAEGGKKMLGNHNLQFTNATQLNDPFDCHPALIDFSNVPAEKCKVWPKEVIEEIESSRYKNYRKDTWLCSLSKVDDAFLMWSYYTNHKGVCIGIDIDKAHECLKNLSKIYVDCLEYEVQYKEIVSKPDYFRDLQDFYSYQLMTKSKDWQHEQEVRLCIYYPHPWIMKPLPHKTNKESIPWIELRAFPEIGRECFVSIGLGVNMSEEDKKQIITLAEKINPDMEVYQMKVDTNSFKLNKTVCLE